MLYHNLKLAFRSLSRHRSFSFINILGLTIGIASCILIGLYVVNEFSFDRFHRHHQHIYRVNKVTNEKGGKAQRDGITPGLLAPAAVKEVPGVIAATRFRPWFNEMLVSHDSIHLKLDDVLFADASFLQVFDFPLLRGDRKTVLQEPYTAVITASTAKKYFKDTDPVGKTLVTLNNIPVKITGVAADVPVNSSIQFNLLISWETVVAKQDFSWMNNWVTQVDFTFLQLNENADPESVANQVSVMMHQHRDEAEFQFRPYLQPLDNIHLHSSGILYADSIRTNTYKIIYTLMIIALFILLIAGFNFLNLSTAAALGRAKETGVQKVLGAKQSQLIGKFFMESCLLCTFSMVLAILLVSLLLPRFNQLAAAQLTTDVLFQPKIFLGIGLLLVFVSLIAGLYPALFLARFKSTDVFRNIIRAGNDKWLRRSLVTIQFALSILLIIATIVVNNQMHYLASKDLGFQKEQVLILPLTNTGMEVKSKELMTALLQYPGIHSVSASNRIPGQGLTGYGIIPEGHRAEEHLLSNVLETDASFVNTYGIKMVKGRYFSPLTPTDTINSIVINEAMARYLNWDDPIDKQLEIFELRKGKIIGVMKDFNFASLRETVQPLAIVLNDNPLYLSIKLKAGDIPSSLRFIQKQWEIFSKDYPFDYFFMDEQLNHYYKSDNRLLHVLTIFAVLAIAIACMGLFGLSMYRARQRTKEIGIRKVLGASVPGTVLLLSKDFIKLVLIASFVAFPLGWWAMNSWLQDFAYRIHLGPWIFLGAAFGTFLIALITVSIQALKAAFANPVKSLRTE